MIVFADIPRMAVGKQQSEQQFQQVLTVRTTWVASEIYVGTLLRTFKTKTQLVYIYISKRRTSPIMSKRKETTIL